jgi:hypothetical protein
MQGAWEFACQDFFRLLRDSSDNVGGAGDVVNEAGVLSHRQRSFIDVARLSGRSQSGISFHPALS